jgi:(p)ppGpp synthase/HD superfamily hydrolase
MDGEFQGPGQLPAVAQTNVALYKQLHAAGWDAPHLAELRDCYEFATLLFVGHCRASGKPFLAHLVGTASILAAMGADRATVAAGLIHAAYDQGDFGLTRWRDRRPRVRQAVGEAAEALVWRYHELGWTEATIVLMRDRLAQLGATDRSIVLMRLANELDDNLDLEMRYCGAAKDAYRGSREILIAMARALGQPGLADALAAAYREADEGAWAAALSLQRKFSYQLASPFGLRLLRLARAAIDAVRR